ncbi:MAG: ABC transporter permease, partial [Calditrichaeota bacterium]
MKRILQMIRKEFRQIFRDPPMLGIIFLVPIVQLFILSYAITTDVKHIKLNIIDHDNSYISREIIRAFAQTERFDLVDHRSDISSIDDNMQAWKSQITLVIPENFSKELKRNLKPQIFVAVDGVDGNTAGIALGYAQSILLNFGAEIQLKKARIAPTKDIHLVEMEERMWYNL